jgi:hypothetical protein
MDDLVEEEGSTQCGKTEPGVVLVETVSPRMLKPE